MNPIGGDYSSAAPNTLGVPEMGAPATPGMDPRKQQMAMMLMAQQMKGMGGQSAFGAPPRPQPPLDIYGQPIQGA